MVIVVNAMAVLLPINGKTTGDVSDRYATPFTPAGITFSIWGLIYLALAGFIIYQLWLAFSGRQPAELERLMQRMRGWWLITCLANSCWLFAWHYEFIPVSMLLMVLLLASLLVIHFNFGIALTPASLREKLLVRLPFSLYLGWISVATAANLGALLAYAGWRNHLVPVSIALVLLVTLAAALMILRRNNIIFGLVAAWALYGIVLKRREAGVMAETPVTQSCVIAIGVVAVAVSWRLYRRPMADGR